MIESLIIEEHNGGAKYVVIFINDYSQFTIVYFIHQKLDVFAIFQAYKTFVENQIDKKIKMLRSDNGGEFTSRAFNAFCELHGITIYKFLLPTTK
jgi:transposase InsO family protein